MRQVIILTILVLFLYQTLNAHGDNVFQCYSIQCRDCKKSPLDLHHEHIMLDYIPHLDSLHIEMSDKNGLLIFYCIDKLTQEEAHVLVESRLSKISFPYIHEFDSTTLFELMKFGRNHETVKKIDSINIVHNNSLRSDSILTNTEFRLIKQAFTGECALILDGIYEISDLEADIIRTFRGIYLQLGGITDLSEKQIRILSRFQGVWLCMPNLNDEDMELFQKLRKEYIKYPK